MLECRRQRHVVVRGDLARGLARSLGRHVGGLRRPADMHEGRRLWRLLLRGADGGGGGSGRGRTVSSLRGSLNDGSCAAAGGRGGGVEGEGDEGRGVSRHRLGGGLEAEGFSKALWEEGTDTVSARRNATGVATNAGDLRHVPTGVMGFVLAHAVFGTLKHELKDFHRGHIAKVQILSLKKKDKKVKIKSINKSCFNLNLSQWKREPRHYRKWKKSGKKSTMSK